MARMCLCGGIITEDGCNRCDNRNVTTDYRPSASKRGYGRPWQKFRLIWLAKHSMCVDCESQGRSEPGVEVHHIKKMQDYPHLKYEPSNLMTLCKECHSIRTGRGE